MKRRELIKTLSVIAAAPFLTSWTNAISSPENLNQIEPNKIPRFGDGRDWFLPVGHQANHF